MGSGAQRFLPLLAAMNDSGGSLSLTEAASFAAMSPWHLQREFADAVGESPAKYQQRLRLEWAALALCSTDERIIDIALTAGFASHEAFTRAFGKHFGASPTTYRRRSASLGTETARRTASSGRCISLHHVSTNDPSPANKEQPMPSTAITTQSIEVTPTVVGRRRVDRAHLSEAFADILPAAFGYAMEKGLTMAGPPFVRYTSQSAAFVEIEAGVPLATAAGTVDAPDLFASSLPGGLAATSIHEGSYDTLGDTHMVLDRWIHEQGHTATGGPWEIYLTDPAEHPNPDDWKTQIVWPIAS